MLAVATTIATFAPWASSGDKARTSYALVDIVDRAGVLSPSAATLSILWYFVPVLCGSVLVAIAFGRVALGGGLATTLGALAAIGGLLVARSSLVIEPGATVGALSGVCTMLAGVTALVTTKKKAER